MLKKSIAYLITVYLIQILNILLNIVLIRNLSLENFGYVNIAKIYFQLMEYTHLGSRFIMDRYIPTYNTKDGKLITVFTMNISLFVSFFFIAVVYFFVNDFVIFMFMSSGLAFTMGSTYKAYFMAKEDTGKMLIVILIGIFLPLIIQIIAIYFFDFYTFVSLFFASYLLSFFLLVYKFRLIYLMRFSLLLDKIKYFYRDIFILFLTSLIIFLSFSLDKILLGSYRGKEALGEYSIIIFAFVTLLIIPSALTELVFPRIIKKITTTSKIIHIKENLFIFLPTLFSLSIANSVMNYFVINFTDYAHLLPYLHLVTWAVLPYALIPIFYHTLNALNKRKIIFKINLLALFIYVLYLYLTLTFVKFSQDFSWGEINFSLHLSSDVLQGLVWGRIMHGILVTVLYLIYLISYNLSLQKK